MTRRFGGAVVVAVLAMTMAGAAERPRPERGAKPPSESERGWGPASSEKSGQAPASPATPGTGWVLPADADTTKNPLAVDEKLITTGKAIYKDKCQKCHGAAGLGDGPDADPELQDDMNLTNPRRTARNSDGVVFFKIWNGRKKPKMPAQSADLTKDQVWAVVSYVQTLRKK